MGTELMSLDPYMKNAYSADVKFDLVPRSCRSPRRREGHGHCVDIGVKSEPGKEWELDVRPMISSRKWLSNYGLKKNKLTLHQLLPSIGFKVSDEYDTSLKRPISSRYSQGYFPQVFRADGKTFNITCTKDKLCQIRNRLQQAVYLYRRRLEWLTTESRRIFGIVEEKALTIVLDIKNMSPHLYDQFCKALEMVLREQISQVVKFNIIRAAEDVQAYSQECIPVTHDTVEGAVQWLRKLDRLAPVSNSALCEAVMKALADDNNEAVYIFTEGSSSDNSRELLKEKVCATSLKVPIHCVSFNCDSAETIKFLRDFCQFTGGKFHAYAVVMEIDSYEPKPVDPLTNKAHLVMKSKTFGGLPAGAGIREDVLLVYEELEEARRALKQVETLIEQAPEPKVTSAFQKKTGEVVELEEQYQSSVDWLKVYGLEARKLSLYHILNAVAFKHLDGVINFMRRAEEETQTDAVVEHRLVNAKYCDQFPVVRWKNGKVMHVQVTPDVYRQYEERMLVALNKIQQRIDWLKAGSRSLFGTVIEEEIYILIDCSASMQASLQFVKNKLFVLLQEQLRHKKRFNLVAFNSKAQCWRSRLVEVNEESLQSAWTWIQGLSCWGSTNTYAALQLALNDPATQAIYLLTDGRPDQPPRSILGQVQLQCRVPMHTISFNCDDMDANQFLYDLAKLTGGRYHYYSDNGPHPEQPEAFESQDIKELKEEMQRGLESLEKLADLRDQCTALAWRREVETIKSCSRDHPLPVQGKLVSAVPPLNSKDLYRPDSAPPRPSSAPLRPSSAPPRPRPLSARPPSPRRTPAPPPRPSTSLGFRQTSTSLRQSIASRPRSARPPREPLKAGHTRTSLMRTLNSNGRFTPTEWLLPETKGLFEKQAVRQKHLAEKENMHERIRSRRRKRLVRRKAASTREWLKKYGLSAKRLTILDALGPTLVPHNAKYVPILDKHVVSKVFDEILPIAHVNKWKQVRLVNPTGVDLKAYEAKLSSAIALYERRLNKLVWDALPNDVREELGGEEPISFEDNRSRLMRALDAAGWPVKEQDISLLEAEIARGRKFLQLSQDLRKANVPSTDDADSDVQELAAAYGRQDRLDEDRYDEPKDDDDDDDDAKDDEAKDDDEDEDREVAEETPAAADAEEERKEKPHFEGLGQVVQSVEPDEVDRAVETLTETKKKKKKVSSKRAQRALDTLKGYRVIARLDDDGLYYPGHVQKSVDFRHAVVRFDSMHRSEKVLSRFIIPMSGAVARPSITRGDPVLIRVVNVDNDTECYIPGIVYCEPARDDHAAKFYTVHLYNGQKACTMRKHLVKLSKTRYEFTVRYICAMQNLDDGINRSRSGSRPRSPTPPSSCSRSYSSDSVSRSRSPDRGGRSSRSSSPPRSPKYVSRPSRRSPRRSRGRDERRLSCEREPARGHDSRSGSRDSSPPRPSRWTARDSSSDEELPPREEEPYRLAEETPREEGESARQLQELRSQLEAQEEQLKEKQKELKRRARSLKRKEKELEKKGRHKRDQTHQTSIDDDALDAYGQLPLLEMRRALPALQHGEEVLARWPDEGWYFRGTVYQDCRDFSYFIKDGANHLERIWREDIISEKDDQSRILKVNSPVVALHPDYCFSYAPGVIMDITPDLHYIVSFYDGVEAKLPFDEVYRLSDAKYRHDVKEIKACEARWIGKAVVSRDDELGVYRLGQVKAQLSSGQQYEIEWSDGTCTTQRAIHLFGPMSKRYPVNLGEKVLALADQDRLWYLPGEVTRLGHKTFQVTFCNNEVGEVSYDDYFWLTQAYYEEAVKFFKECMRKMGF